MQGKEKAAAKGRSPKEIEELIEQCKTMRKELQLVKARVLKLQRAFQEQLTKTSREPL